MQIEALNLIFDAANKNASDIHLEPAKTHSRIRFRIDGLLREISHPTKVEFNALLSQLKIRANLNIAEKRLPQEGRITFPLKKNMTLDTRLSFMPTLYGEKVVIRLLNPNATIPAIEQLGMNEKQQKLYLEALAKPQGLIILTGPTGCGKTTTLYSGLSHCNTSSRNLYTIEDPIEITLAGINQININRNLGFDFKHALKSILRQDPDIIMIGEIRDIETAEIAIHAAQTGHLVLATLHSKNTAESILRLEQLGVNLLGLMESLLLIISQRLLRKRCSYCLGETCTNCFQGFLGRLGIFELLTADEEIKSLFYQSIAPHEIVKQAKIQTLEISALNQVNLGLTTYEELQRVIG